MSNFFEGLGSKLSERWLEYLFSPALIFYGAGALLLYVRFANPIGTWVAALSEPAQIALVVAGFMLVVQSAVLMERFAPQGLSWLCGNWPVFLSWPAKQRKAAHVRRFQSLEGEWQKTNDGEIGQKLDQYPPNASDVKPTLLGNILLAAERFPRDKYGLDPAVCWPELWLVLPKTTRLVISGARKRLDEDVVSILWGVLALAWAVVDWRVLPLAVIWVWLFYRQALQSACGYSVLFKAAFDLHRMDLYRKLNWPIPRDTAEEAGCGERLSQYLYLGKIAGVVVFERADK
jgi:hypothetical protein